MPDSSTPPTAPLAHLGDRPIRVGIVGLGSIYRLNREGYLGNPDAEVIAICDVDKETLESRADDFPDAERFTSLDDLLACDLDLVEVLVPSPLHCEVVCAALDAGFHVNVQKPMADTMEQADLMLAARDRSGKVLRIMEDFLHFGPLIKAKQIIESGEIGKPIAFHAKVVGCGRGGWDVPEKSTSWHQEQNLNGPGHMVYDDGWHKFAVARWLLGPVEEVHGWIGQTWFTPEHVLDVPATIMWQHANGARAIMDISVAPETYWRSDTFAVDERFEITGTKGFVRVNRCTARGIEAPALEVYVDGVLRTQHDLTDDWTPIIGEQTKRFLRILKGQETGDLDLDADLARDILALTLGAIESSRRTAPIRLDEAPWRAPTAD